MWWGVKSLYSSEMVGLCRSFDLYYPVVKGLVHEQLVLQGVAQRANKELQLLSPQIQQELGGKITEYNRNTLCL